jgi:ribokinase
MTQRIVIVGSLNMDFVVQMEKLPMCGETVSGWGFQMLPGGKGANQACAVGRLGGSGKMIGCVGEDVFGDRLKDSLNSAGVDTSSVQAVTGESTGVALINVERGGQNQIVVAAGANACLSPSQVETAIASQEGGYILMQLESPMETVEAAAQLGRAHGMTTILDPAPAKSLSASLLGCIDVLTPNETEALLLLGRNASTVPLAEAPELARQLLRLGPKRVILKLGEKGAWLADRERSRHFPAQRVDAVDATAAGDTFNGALSVALSEGKTIEEALAFANCAAAISVTRLGAQSSIPLREEVDILLVAQSQFSPV